MSTYKTNTEWKKTANEMRDILVRLDDFFQFSETINPREGFAIAMNIGGGRLDQLNRIFKDAKEAIERSGESPRKTAGIVRARVRKDDVVAA